MYAINFDDKQSKETQNAIQSEYNRMILLCANFTALLSIQCMIAGKTLLDLLSHNAHQKTTR